MGRTRLLQVLACVALLFMLSNIAFAQSKDPIVRLWYNAEKTAKIQVFVANDGKYYGKIVWLREPLKDGKTKVDINNPSKDHRSDPILGLMLLKGFKKHGDHTYENGTIYDPKNGKTYSCTINHKGNTLDVRGYVGFSLFGRTTTWTQAE